MARCRNYLHADPRGFIGLDWAKFRADSGYDQAYANQVSTGTNTGTNPGFIQEGRVLLRGDGGPPACLAAALRLATWACAMLRTEQTFGTLVSTADPRNAQLNLGDGGRFPEPHHGRAAPGLQQQPALGTLATTCATTCCVSGSETMTARDPGPAAAAAVQRPVGRPGHAHQLKPQALPLQERTWAWQVVHRPRLSGRVLQKGHHGPSPRRRTSPTSSATWRNGTGPAQLTQQQRDAIAVRSGPQA